MNNEEWREAVARGRARRAHDRFAEAALTGLLAGPHFSPGGKRISDLKALSIEELAMVDCDDFTPNSDDLKEYADTIVLIAKELADRMMEGRE